MSLQRFIVAHSFRGFNPWLVGLAVLGPVARQNMMMGACADEAAHFMIAGKQGKKEEQGSVSQFPSNAHPL